MTMGKETVDDETAHQPRAGLVSVTDAGSVRAVVRCEVTSSVLDVAAHESAVSAAAAGAVVSFAGVVRDLDGGRTVRELEYVAHPLAQQRLVEVAEDILAAAEGGITAVAVSHRVGLLAIGDAALVAAVSAPHRAEAFEFCGRLVDEVKARIPVWKRQVFADGTEEWVNCA